MQAQTKRKILLWMAWGTGTVLLCAILWYLSYIGQFMTYKDLAYKFSVKFPRHWQVVMHPQPGGAVLFVSPKKNALETWQAKVAITVQDVPVSLSTVKELTDQIKLQMTTVFKNIKVEESKPVTFGDRKGYRVLFSTEKPEPIKILNVWTIKMAEKAYIFTYMATNKQYAADLGVIEEMIKSFQFQSR